MRVIADFLLTPIGLSEPPVHDYLAECVRILNGDGVKTHVHACGINVEGEWNLVFSSLEKCHQALHEMGATEVSASVRVETRVGYERTVDDSIRLVKKGIKKSRITTGNYQPEPVKSPYCDVKRSKIHNLGVYATQFIPDGTRIIEYVGDKVTKKRADDIYEESLNSHLKDKSKGSVYLFVINNKYDINGDVPWNTARYINHSCDPNCETDIIKGHIWIQAIRDIQKGEELSYDYGYDLDSWEDHPCLCGTDSCVGYIVDEMERPKLKKILKKKGVLKESGNKSRSARS